jgi:DNA-binding NarL/FixJ family response regulator
MLRLHYIPGSAAITPPLPRPARIFTLVREHRRAQTPNGRDDLTPQERQIAPLAAEGPTNREIGALLFLSPRTIETHLGSVFRKLGIRDHTALNTTDPSEA